MCGVLNSVAWYERLWIKAKTAWAWFSTRSPIARGCALHPRAIGDPRGRFFVREKLQLCNNGGMHYVVRYSQLTVEEK
jgi:hypothetical protein